MRGMGLFILCLALIGCDAQMANFNSIGSPGHIRCWSGTLLVYEGDSTGKVAATAQSDGWEFVDAKTHKFIRVSGTCVVEN